MSKLKTYGKAAVARQAGPSDPYWDIIDDEKLHSGSADSNLKRAKHEAENADPEPAPKRSLRGKKSASTNSLPKSAAAAPVRKRKAADSHEVTGGSLSNITNLNPCPIAASTVIEFDETKPQAARNQADRHKQEFKLFEMSDSGSIDLNSVSSSLSSLNNNTKLSTRATCQRSSNSTNNNYVKNSDASVSATATAIVNSANSTAYADDYMLLEQQRSKLVKSIMKLSCGGSSKEMPPPPMAEAAARPKRSVKILEKLEDKTDKILNVKCDNRTKHTASTSTPSGLRRRPLKAPQNVSMIGKAE